MRGPFDLHDDLLQVGDDLFRSRAEPADHADRLFNAAVGREAAARVDVVRLQRGFHLLQRESVLVQRGWIDEHLVLLPAAAHGEHLGDAGDLQQSRPDDPVGERAERELPLEFGGEYERDRPTRRRSPARPDRPRRSSGDHTAPATGTGSHASGSRRSVGFHADECASSRRASHALGEERRPGDRNDVAAVRARGCGGDPRGGSAP